MKNGIELTTPYFVGNEKGLYIKRYPCHFGDFQLLSLVTDNDNIVIAFKQFCKSKSYYDNWILFKRNDKTFFEMVKIPVALLIEIIKYQNDEQFSYMKGAWSIGLTPFSSSVNIIISRNIINKIFTIDKISLYYPESFDKTKLQFIPLEQGISFRTGIFNSENIQENRYHLAKLRKYDSIKADLHADAIYVVPTTSKHERINKIDKFVKEMIRKNKKILHSSYVDSNRTVLEDEWNSFKRLLSIY